MSFCMNCGTELPDGAKFCYKCGEKVNIPIKSDMEESQRQNMQERNSNEIKCQIPKGDNLFIFEGVSFCFDRNTMRVIQLRKNFHENAWKRRCDFDKYYREEIKTIEDLFGKGLVHFFKCIEESLVLANSTLCKNGVDSYSTEDLYNLVYDNMGISMDTVWQPLTEEREKIQIQAERMESYRQSKKAGRSQWMGGGFGLSGALKGAFTAGALNMTSGAIHKISDGISSLGDRAKIENLEENLVNSEKTREWLVHQMYNYCFSIAKTIHLIISNVIDIPYNDCQSKQLINTINNNVNLYLGKSIKKADVINRFVDLLQYNPFVPEVYEIIYSAIPEAEDSLLQIVQLIGFESQFKSKIKEIRNKYRYTMNFEENELKKSVYGNCMDEINSVSGNSVQDLKMKIAIVDKYILDYPDVNFKNDRKLLLKQLEKIQKKDFFILHDKVKKMCSNSEDISDKQICDTIFEIDDFIKNHNEEEYTENVLCEDKKNLQDKLEQINQKKQIEMQKMQMKEFVELHDKIQSLLCNSENYSARQIRDVLLEIEDFEKKHSVNEYPEKIIHEDKNSLQEKLEQIKKNDQLEMQNRVDSIMSKQCNTIKEIQGNIEEIKLLLKEENSVPASFFRPYINQLTELAFRKQVYPLLKKYYRKIGKYNSFRMGEEITQKQLQNAKNVIGLNEAIERVIGFYDFTVSMCGKEGLIFTDNEMFYREVNSETIKISYNDINSVEIIQNGKKEASNQLKIELNNRTAFFLTSSLLDKTSLFFFFRELIQLNSNPFVEIEKQEFSSDELKNQNNNINNDQKEFDIRTDGHQNREFRKNNLSKSEMISLLNKYKSLAAWNTFYLSEDIPDKKLKNAISKYAHDVDKTKIIALYDTTILGSAKEGFIFTETEIYYSKAMSNRRKIKYANIVDVKIIENGKNDQSNEIKFLMDDGSYISWIDNSLNKKPLYNFFCELLWE